MGSCGYALLKSGVHTTMSQQSSGLSDCEAPSSRGSETAPDPPGGSMTIDTFCERNDISRSFFYKMKKDGTGPNLCQIGAAVRISYSAEAAWLKRGEKRAKKAAAT